VDERERKRERERERKEVVGMKREKNRFNFLTKINIEYKSKY
jgi:hypothetical protein